MIEVEIILIGLIVIFIVSYRTKQGESVYKFISQQAVNTYKKLEPYSFKIMREKVKELTSSKLFGGSKEKSFAYELTVRNTKKEPITIIVEDQVPLSQEKDIEIKVSELSGGIQFTGSGIVKWKITLQPGESTKKTLSYSIKYPKDKQLSGL